jgi:hypothetical protein
LHHFLDASKSGELNKFALFMNKFYMVCGHQGTAWSQGEMLKQGRKVWATNFKDLYNYKMINERPPNTERDIQLFKYLHTNIEQFLPVTKVIANLATNRLTHDDEGDKARPASVFVNFSPISILGNNAPSFGTNSKRDMRVLEHMLINNIGVCEHTAQYLSRLVAVLTRNRGDALQLIQCALDIRSYQYSDRVGHHKNLNWDRKGNISLVTHTIPKLQAKILYSLSLLDLTDTVSGQADRAKFNTELVSKVCLDVIQLQTHMKKAVAQIADSISKKRQRDKEKNPNTAGHYAFLSSSNPGQLWRDVYKSMTNDSGKIAKTSSLNIEDLIRIGRELQDSVIIHIPTLYEDYEDRCNLREFHEELLNWFPVLIVNTQGSNSYVVNHADLDEGQPGTGWLDLLEIFNEAEEPEYNPDKPEDVVRKQTLDKMQAKIQESWVKKGRPPHHLRFPDIPRLAMEFISTETTLVDARRRSTIIRSMGVSLKEIRTYLYGKIPKLKEFGMDLRTVRRLMFPPKRNTRAAEYYHAVVNAHKPLAHKDIRKKNMDGHHVFAEVRINQECMVRFPDECVLFSADHMNKLNVGIAAVSSYHRNAKFYPRGKNPRTSDHDFPKGPRYKIDVAGYLALLHPENYFHATGHRHKCEHKDIKISYQDHDEEGFTKMDDGNYVIDDNVVIPDPPEDRDEEPEYEPPCDCRLYSLNTKVSARPTIKDKYGRDHYQVPKHGPAYVTLRPLPFVTLNNCLEVNDFHRVLSTHYPSYKAVGVCVDGGTEYFIRNRSNLGGWWSVFKKSELESLWVYSHAAGLSAYNLIERVWSRISRCFAGVTLPAEAKGDTQCPHEMAGQLNLEDMRAKLVEVFTNAIKRCGQLLDGQLYVGYDIHTTLVEPDEIEDWPMMAITAKQRADLTKFAKLETLQSFPEELKTILLDTQCMLAHMDKRYNSVYFNVCSDDKCKLPQCLRKTKIAKKWCSWFQKDMSGRMYTVTPNPAFKGHYYTFCEMEALRKKNKWKWDNIDAWLPSVRANFTNSKLPLYPGRCKFGCKYVYVSEKEKRHHESMFHGEDLKIAASKKQVLTKMAAGIEIDLSKMTCSKCSTNFWSTRRLKKHVTTTNHSQEKKKRRSGKSFPEPASVDLPADEVLISLQNNPDKVNTTALTKKKKSSDGVRSKKKISLWSAKPGGAARHNEKSKSVTTLSSSKNDENMGLGEEVAPEDDEEWDSGNKSRQKRKQPNGKSQATADHVKSGTSQRSKKKAQRKEKKPTGDDENTGISQRSKKKARRKEKKPTGDDENTETFQRSKKKTRPKRKQPTVDDKNAGLSPSPEDDEESHMSQGTEDYWWNFPDMKVGDIIIWETGPGVTLYCGQVLDCSSLGEPPGSTIKFRHYVHDPPSLRLGDERELYPGLLNPETDLVVTKPEAKYPLVNYEQSTAEVVRESVRDIPIMTAGKLPAGYLRNLRKEMKDSVWRRERWSNFSGEDPSYPSSYEDTYWSVCSARNECVLRWKGGRSDEAEQYTVHGRVVYFDSFDQADLHANPPQYHGIMLDTVFVWLRVAGSYQIWMLKRTNMSNKLFPAGSSASRSFRAAISGLLTVETDVKSRCKQANTKFHTLLPKIFLQSSTTRDDDRYMRWKMRQAHLRVTPLQPELLLKPFLTEILPSGEGQSSNKVSPSLCIFVHVVCSNSNLVLVIFLS